MKDMEDQEILKQLQAIQTLLDAVVQQLSEDAEDDEIEGPEVEEPMPKSKGSLLSRIGG